MRSWREFVIRARRKPAVAAMAALLALSTATPASAAAGLGSVPPTVCRADVLQAGLPRADGIVTGATLNTSGSFTPPGQPAVTGLPAFCRVTMAKPDGAGHDIGIEVWLPTAGWNGRFQGVGGGGYSCGISYPALGKALGNGYAAASTDCGHQGGNRDGSFALTAGRRLDWPLITDFASRGIHDMTVVGKDVTKAFFDRLPSYSYFTGCSTGGRQGLMEVQRFPGDYDGIVSGAPAINWTRFIPAEIWPQLVMNEAADFLPACKQQAFTAAVVKACDALDGVTDGVIGNVDACRWNPHALVGTVTPCGTVTATDADVVAKIWEGPKTAGRPLWFGLEPGADFSGLAGTTTDASGNTTGAAFPITVAWFGTWLQRDPAWDWRTLTFSRFEQLFAQSVKEFGPTIATDDPDLSAFAARGGKVLLWHGLADELIFPQGTVDYYQRVQRAMRGGAATAQFARLFLAPGASHCRSAAGPMPDDPLAAVVAWVEHGRAPQTVPASLTTPAGTEVTRKLCPYPQVARYNRTGNPDDADSFTCARTYR
ncbi:tannase/feruloyl esterase family alpha/beta hydrolase [Amycolatopsis sp. NPDC021455]|uniref:tannase/feruloyl esterase family alpha/beta hydrolase n=1 Tax=Amycolatopsis sp. NPDC021455 TaxID=3154901 RepID=UPI003402BB2B